MEWDWNTATIPYGERWRTQRRHMQRFLHSGAVSAHFPAQTAKVNELIIRLRTHQAVSEVIRRALAASFMTPKV
jgi:hypothetical protein